MRDAFGMPQSLLVLGGRSEIGLAAARALARRRARRIVLAVREPDRPCDVKPLEAMGVEVDVVAFDALDYDSHPRFVTQVFERYGGFDAVLLAFGILGNQSLAERDGKLAHLVMSTNAVGAASVMVPLLKAMRTQGHGVLIVLSSVAAERPRKANFFYGASKAALDGLAHGYAHALWGSGVSVMVVRPGFVRSRMTSGLEPPPLSTTPEAVAEAIVDGLRRGRSTVWVPATLRVVMAVLRHLPTSIWRRLDI